MYTYKAILDRVVDGDTIDAHIDLGFDITIHKRIRLAGIDTPESRTRDLEEKKRGLASKDKLIELLYFAVYRDANAGGDTFNADAELLGVAIQYREHLTVEAAW